MKVKHNKKRNTAFLFEALIKELTKSVISKETRRTKFVKDILREHFRSGTVLSKELECYNALVEKSGLDNYTAEKMVFRAKKAYDNIGHSEIFKEQSLVIKKINENLGKDVYGNFVPNYQSLASLAQIFSDKLPVKSRVLMEQRIIESITSEESPSPEMKTVDSLVMQKFIERFNDTYGELLEEQKELLTRYITSFSESGADFRLFVGRELQRISEAVSHSMETPEVSEDLEIVENTKKVLEKIGGLNVSQLTEKDILRVLKLQRLVREYKEDANQN
jgi:hypothetical protein